MPKQSPNRSDQIRLWAKRMRSWRTNKEALLQLLLERGYTKTAAQAWMRTPIPKLGNRAPRDMLNPISVAKLYRYAKKYLEVNTIA